MPLSTYPPEILACSVCALGKHRVKAGQLPGAAACPQAQPARAGPACPLLASFFGLDVGPQNPADFGFDKPKKKKKIHHVQSGSKHAEWDIPLCPGMPAGQLGSRQRCARVGCMPLMAPFRGHEEPGLGPVRPGSGWAAEIPTRPLCGRGPPHYTPSWEAIWGQGVLSQASGWHIRLAHGCNTAPVVSACAFS